MLPQSFTERMQGLLGSEYEEFLVSFDHEKYQALRLNPLKKDDMSVITEISFLLLNISPAITMS